MKTFLFIATLLISTVTFSQSTKKPSNSLGSTQEHVDRQMNKAELIDAISKNSSTSNDSTTKSNTTKSYGSTRSNKQTIRTNENENPQGSNRASINENPLYKAKSNKSTNPLYND